MLARFTGDDSRSLVVAALANQSVIGQDQALAESMYEHAEIMGFQAGCTIIEDTAPDNDIYFILAGVVSIQVLGREIAVRSAGQHIGEMAAVDPGKSRSASAVADADVIVARVPASDFTNLARHHSQLWHHVARELATRLRQRNQAIAPMNPRPVLFVGCSVESLPVAHALQSALSHDPIIVRLWADNVFQASQFPIESLEKELPRADFAVLVLHPDDVVITRNTSTNAPRDNIIFELGLFMGALGRSRTFLICPAGVDIKIPSDLAGLIPLTYDSDPHVDASTAVAPACNELRRIITTDGPR